MSHYGPEDYEDYGPSDELSSKIHELIETEAKVRFKGVFDELEHSRKRNTDLSQELTKLRQQISNNEANIKKALREKETEVKRELFGGFTINDKIFFADYKWQSRKCPKCEGEKKIRAVIDGVEEKVRCPSCDGGGTKDSSYYLPKEDEIRTVDFELGQYGKHLHFWLKHKDSKVKIDQIFRTLEECTAYCDVKNLPKAIETTA